MRRFGPLFSYDCVCIGKGEMGHSQCDLSVTPVQHKPAPQCGRFSDLLSRCVCSRLIFIVDLWTSGPVKTALSAGPCTTCYTYIVGNHSRFFASVLCSALDGGQSHLLVEAARPGAEAGRIPRCLGITSHCDQADSALCGYSGTETVLHYPKVKRNKASTGANSQFSHEKV